MVEEGATPDEGQVPEERDQLLEELLMAIDVATERLKSLASLEVGELAGKDRQDLTERLDALQIESKRVLESFGRRCGFCRGAPAQIVGNCAQCGVEACQDCAVAFEGVILHRGTCTAFYGGVPTV
jgi:hypothetical protein